MPEKPLVWSAENFRGALAKGRGRRLSIQDMFTLLAKVVRARDLGHVSSWYRYASDDESSGPPAFMWPVIARILGCEVEDLTRPADLIADPDDFDWDDVIRSDVKPSKRKSKSKKGSKRAS